MSIWKKLYLQLLSGRYGFGVVTFDGVGAGLFEEDGEPEYGRIIAEYVCGDPQVNHFWLTDGRVEPAGETMPGTPRYFIRGHTFALEMEYNHSGKWRRYARQFVTWGDVDLKKLRAALKQSRSREPLSFTDATQLATV